MTIAESIQNIDSLTALRESALVYPCILATHLTCIAIFGGMILITDLRLLGLTYKSLTITDVVTTFRPWKRLGGLIMIVMGLLLASSEAVKYAPNPFFWTKMVILGLICVHALIFRPIVYNQTEELDRSPVIPTKAKVAAILSLVLWTGMFTMGRLIAYWEPPVTPAPQTSIPQREAFGVRVALDANPTRTLRPPVYGRLAPREALAGEPAKAEKAYQDFFALWKTPTRLSPY